MPFRFAPILSEVASRLSGEQVALMRFDPARWAYALREAVALAEPDVVVSHHDLRLEADALRRSREDAGDDWLDAVCDAPALSHTGAGSAVALVETLAGIFRGGPAVAAVVAGPVTVAAQLVGDREVSPESTDELAGIADVVADRLAELIGAYEAAGASMVLVVEPQAAALGPADACAAQAPVVRAAAHHGLKAVLCGPLDDADYPLVARPWHGGDAPDAALLPAELWELEEQAFDTRLGELAAQACAADSLLLTDGPIPGSAPLERLQMARAAVKPVVAQGTR